VAAAGSAGKRGGKNFLMRGELRGRGCCGNWVMWTSRVENERRGKVKGEEGKVKRGIVEEAGRVWVLGEK